MTPHAWIALVGMFLSLVVMGGKAYLAVRDRLTRIEAILNNGMSHKVSQLEETTESLARSLEKHLGWADQKATDLERRISNKEG